MSVNRYDPEDWGGLHMVPKPDGDWVCYEAWEHVNRQIAALKEENERLKAEKVQINGKLAGSRLAVSRLEARVAELVSALEEINGMDRMSYHSLESAQLVARLALSAYRKQGGE